MSNFSKLKLVKTISNAKALHAFSRKQTTCFLAKSSTMFFSSFIKNKRMGRKSINFHITDSTRRRISNMEVDKINGLFLSSLSRKAGETGFAYFNDKLHFAYSITRSSIYIMASLGDSSRKSNDPSFEAGNLIIGYIEMNFLSTETSIYVNNPIDVITNNQSLLLIEPDVVSMLKKVKRGDMEQPIFDKYKKDHQEKYSKLTDVLKAFTFLHLAKIIDTTKLSEEDSSIKFSDRVRYLKSSIIEIIQVDTLYDENSHTVNPFGVKGHFRNQPIGENREERKLIYIDEFMKTGYHRTATKVQKQI